MPRVLILQSPDDARSPYETALGTPGFSVEWFTTLDALVGRAASDPPLAVVVDLEALDGWNETHLERVRTAFAGSELIALSGTDSAHVALQCLRTGFTDFLLKPTSPEELAWSVRKAEQRCDLLRRLEDPKARMVRAVTQIGSCNSATLVRLCALEYLVSLFGARGAAWLVPGADGTSRIAASFPTQSPGDPAGSSTDKATREILWRAPERGTASGAVVVRGKRTHRRKVLLPCKEAAQGTVFLWGIEGPVPARRVTDGHLLVHHGELSLLNLTKLEEIKQLTFLDDLTGLYNSRYLKFALTNAMLRCKQPGQSFSVLFLDVDHFKAVNDRHGHLVGSEFLVAIGRTIKNAVRHVDPVFRYGGDEFVVILQDTPLTKAAEIAERIRSHVERRVFAFGEERVQTTVSIGLAAYPDTASDVDTLLQLADRALYAVKKERRNAVHLAEIPAKTLA